MLHTFPFISPVSNAVELTQATVMGYRNLHRVGLRRLYVRGSYVVVGGAESQEN